MPSDRTGGMGVTDIQAGRSRRIGEPNGREVTGAQFVRALLALLGLALLGGAVFLRRDLLLRGGERQRRDLASVDAAPDVLRSIGAHWRAEPQSEHREAAIREVAAEPIEATDTSDSDSARERAEILAKCRSAIEAALLDSMDVEPLLEAGLLAAEGELNPRVILEADGSGDLCFPVEGLPKGAQAEFRVSQGTPDHPQILSIRLAFDKPGEPYLLEQAMRERPEVTCKCFFNQDGGVERVGVLTKVDIDYPATENALGVDFRRGQLAEGMLYSINLLDRTRNKLKVHGLAGGQPRSWDSASSPYSPYDVDRLNTLGTRLFAMYRSVAPDSAKGETRR